MTFTFKLARRIAHSRPFAPRLLAAALLLAGCADSVGTEPSSPSTPDTARSSTTVASVTVTPGSASGSVGQSAQFTAVARNSSGTVLTGRTVTWASGNSAVVSVTSSGYATAIGGGSTTVSATVGGVTGHAAVTVTGTPAITVGSVTVTPGTVSGNVGDSATLTASVKDASGAAITSVPVTWASSNAAVATVDSTGTVRALSGGSADLIATAGGKSGKSTITVASTPVVTVGSVTVSPGSASGNVGDAAQFTATVKDASGADMTGQTITWSSSNTSVVTVTATGYATAVGGGTASLIATAGGKSGSAAITVSGAVVSTAPVATVGLSPSSATIGIGSTQQLAVTLKDAAGNTLTGRTVTWSSTSPLIGAVSISGLVSGLLTGTTTVTATSEGQSASATITVSAIVTPPPGSSEPTYQAGSGSLIWKDTFDGLASDAALLGNYTTIDGESGIHADARAGMNGTGAARIDWQASTACQDNSHLLERGMTPTREVIVTYTVRYTPSFVFDWQGRGPCTGNAKKLFFLYSVSGSRFDFISENHWLGMGSDYDHPLFDQNAGPAVSDEQLGDGQWHRITIRVRQSSTPTATDGYIYGWIDGVQRWAYPNVASNASGGWQYFHFPSTFNQGSPVNQSEWVDDLTVWTP